MKLHYLAILAAALCSPSYASNSIDGQVELHGNAGAGCLPALPIYDGAVRKRPLAVQNESPDFTGRGDAYVTCNFIVDKRAATQYGGTENFSIVARNVYAPGPRTITCMAVIGVDDGAAIYHGKTVTVNPGGPRQTMTWESSAYGFAAAGFPGPVSMSCKLPAGTALNEWAIHWDTEDRIN